MQLLRTFFAWLPLGLRVVFASSVDGGTTFLAHRFDTPPAVEVGPVMHRVHGHFHVSAITRDGLLDLRLARVAIQAAAEHYLASVAPAVRVHIRLLRDDSAVVAYNLKDAQSDEDAVDSFLFGYERFDR